MNEEVDSQYFREKVWKIINTIQSNQLFVHSDFLETTFEDKNLKSKSTKKKKSIHKKSLPKILTLAVLNAIVPNSAMLFIGGHGGGKTSIVKYLGRMFTGISLSEAEECILRAHPQLTEEKIIATLNIKKLMKDGEEEVVWRKFSTSFWKIIDEVNRCSPYTQNILLSLLAEGKIKYYDSIMNVNKYCLYATLNPQDVGTFELSPPFLDRFGISVPFSMPRSQDLSIILTSKDDRLGGYDELIQVPAILSEEELLNIWYEVARIPCSKDAEDFIQTIIREFTLCDRVDKGNTSTLRPSTGLCTGCHYNTEKTPCSKVDSILSVRVAKDLLRFGRGLAWLLDLNEVSINQIIVIAPYIISHRVKYLDRELNQTPFWGDKYVYTEYLLKMVLSRFAIRKSAYEIVNDYYQAKGTPDQLDILKKMAKNDLIIQNDLLPLVQRLKSAKYKKMYNKIHKAENSQDIKELAQIQEELLHEMDLPNRSELITKTNEILRELTLHTYNCSMEQWAIIHLTIENLYPQFSKKLDETTKNRGTYRLMTGDLKMEINVTGTHTYDIVNFNFYGAGDAQTLEAEIQKNHKNTLMSMNDLLEQVGVKKAEENKDIMEKIRHVDKIREEEMEDLFNDDFYEGDE